jgi:hypothetical protein
MCEDLELRAVASAASTLRRLSLLLSAAGLSTACASFQPQPPHEAGFMQRAQIQGEDRVTVTVAVPSAKEAAAVFGVPLGKRRIQPVWVRIENNDDVNYVFVPADLDPDYFSPQEVAWSFRSGFSSRAKREMQLHFETHGLSWFVPRGNTVEGFIHTNQDDGVKYVSVLLYYPGRTKAFEYVVEVPGIRADYAQVDFDKVVPPELRREVDLDTLRQALETYPCCVLGPDGKTPGDPLNIVLIAPGSKVFHPLVRRGWDPTETVSSGTIIGTIRSSLFGVRYRTSPVSSLYLHARRQDIALQKARGSVDQRNHLRLWLTPLKYEGNDVWLGQISRDIGVKLSSKTITTHKIDPDVDETRDYLVQDILLSGALARVGYVRGVGRARPEEPRYNYTLDPYFTDGLRAVLFMSEDYVSPDDLELLRWESPASLVNRSEK